jgi:hypothetical protein
MAGTHLGAELDNYDQDPLSDLTTYGATLLNSSITSAAAIAAGIKKPYPTFTGSVAQALRPYPQYLSVDTGGGAGDHSGKSNYNAAIFQAQKRFGNGLTFQASYVFSKLLTNQDIVSGNTAMDAYHRNLEKSIGEFDLTHNVKAAWIYELPFGKGRRFLTSGAGSAVLGGWRLSATQFYSSGMPVALATTVSLPLFGGTNRPTVPSNQGWGCSKIKQFDPTVDNFFVPASFFGPQPTTVFGDATRYDPSCRQFPNYNENLSVLRSFRVTEKMHLDFRFEAFNLFNRVRFGTGSTTLQSSTFGHLLSNSDLLNTPRQMQVALKLVF